MGIARGKQEEDIDTSCIVKEYSMKSEKIDCGHKGEKFQIRSN